MYFSCGELKIWHIPCTKLSCPRIRCRLLFYEVAYLEIIKPTGMFDSFAV
jgi:hypothetical protein